MSARGTIALATAATVIGGGAIATVGAGAQDYGPITTGPVTIKMKLKGKRTFFSGPKRISQGEKLTVVNKTSPKKIGPHTFSLVKPGLIPTTKKQRKSCFEGKGICFRIAVAHKFDPKTEKVNKAKVEVGGKGWNKSFGKVGDSWYVDRRGDLDTRRVSAPVGTTLTYFCAVHPAMKGKIKVVD
jgi:hypothetical protein